MHLVVFLSQRAFELLDKDGNGVITVQELQQAAEQVGHQGWMIN